VFQNQAAQLRVPSHVVFRKREWSILVNNSHKPFNCYHEGGREGGSEGIKEEREREGEGEKARERERERMLFQDLGWFF